MKGVLKKQGEGWTFGAPFWRERYFKEDSANARIAYYKSINEANPQGFIDYSTITEVVVCGFFFVCFFFASVGLTLSARTAIP
jgi:hypothetical protein